MLVAACACGAVSAKEFTRVALNFHSFVAFHTSGTSGKHWCAAFSHTTRDMHSRSTAKLVACCWPLPESCPARSLLHIECPGCGLTRSFIHLAHGDWRASWNVHRVGWFLALAVVLQIPYRLVALRSDSGLPLGTSFPKLFGTLLIVLLLVNWLINLISRLLN